MKVSTLHGVSAEAVLAEQLRLGVFVRPLFGDGGIRVLVFFDRAIANSNRLLGERPDEAGQAAWTARLFGGLSSRRNSGEVRVLVFEM